MVIPSDISGATQVGTQILTVIGGSFISKLRESRHNFGKGHFRWRRQSTAIGHNQVPKPKSKRIGGIPPIIGDGESNAGNIDDAGQGLVNGNGKMHPTIRRAAGNGHSTTTESLISITIINNAHIEGAEVTGRSRRIVCANINIKTNRAEVEQADLLTEIVTTSVAERPKKDVLGGVCVGERCVNLQRSGTGTSQSIRHGRVIGHGRIAARSVIPIDPRGDASTSREGSRIASGGKIVGIRALRELGAGLERCAHQRHQGEE